MMILYFSLLILIYSLALFLVFWLLKKMVPEKGKWRGISYALAHIILGLFFIQACFWIIVNNRLASSPPGVRQYYHYCFSEQVEDGGMSHKPGLAINYKGHHYLNYALNPEIPYCGNYQFNQRYRIRRTEPIRDRAEVKWRALAIGGSTTFGEGLPYESQTWPFQLERKIRQTHGKEFDVINCGVGGYTIMENLIHYVTLLRHTKPDLVILFVGVNDVSPRLFGRLRLDYSNYRKQWDLDRDLLRRPDPWLSYFYPYRHYYLVDRILELQELGIAAVVSKKGPRLKEWDQALKRNSSDLYENILKNFVKLLKGSGLKTLILPQPFVVVKQRDQVFARGVREHNQVNERVAGNMSIFFEKRIIDKGVFIKSDFIDNCHFNEKGSRKMAEQVYSYLIKNSLLPERSD